MEIDAERQQKAKEYARIRHRLLLVDLAIAAGGVLIVLLSGLGTWLRNILHPLAWQPIPGWFPMSLLKSAMRGERDDLQYSSLLKKGKSLVNLHLLAIF